MASPNSKSPGVAASQHMRNSVRSGDFRAISGPFGTSRRGRLPPILAWGSKEGLDMAWRRTTAAAAVLTLFVLSTGARAKDLPIWMPPDARAAVASESGAYVWVDGARHSVHLPGFALGFKTFDANDLDTGTTNAFDPHPTGGGFRGALGYVLPDNVLPPGFGSHVRVEIAGSFVRASDSQAGIANPSAAEVGLQFLNGVVIPNGFVCNGVIAVCSVAAALGTSYRQWDIGAKIASDFMTDRKRVV